MPPIKINNNFLIKKKNKLVPSQILKQYFKKSEGQKKKKNQKVYKLWIFFSGIEHLITTFIFKPVKASSRYLRGPKGGEAEGFLT